MKKLLNVLYVTQPDYYLKKEGRNIVVTLDGKRVARYPIHILRQIVCFNYMGVSPRLMKMCMEEQVALSFFTPYGKYCGRLLGASYGNIYTRKRQYELAASETSLDFVKNIIYAKSYNSRKILIRFKNDHKNAINYSAVQNAIDAIKDLMLKIQSAPDKDSVRGLEGLIARTYFAVLDELILKQKEDFYFRERSKRPPMDRFNALLSFMYALYTNNIAAALEGVGIDAYAGFFHTDRPGRVSMALDIIEEMRAYVIDKFCLSLVNLNRIGKVHFEIKENGACLLNEKGRDIVLKYWNKREQEEIFHPFTEEKIKLGLLPHVQAQLLNSYLRGDINAYPPFMIGG
ncbi:type I-C CRISPR-associated endonuclease Cas1c [Peptococcus simiae]|uniref:type I-C CRISPR-associated endonuclease Cas1c n=1 Tax=Peptococcus simiae TaxID=1643805 RepID=UPI00398148FB